jgi:lipoprotein-anchoring transpeptidase ErfK/SrfK
MVLLVGGWTAYHGFSYLALKLNSNSAAGYEKNSSEKNEVMARIVSTPTAAGENTPVEEMILLAGTKKPAGPTVTPKPVSPSGPDELKIEKILSESNELVTQGKIVKARTLLNKHLAENFAAPANDSVRQRALELGKQTILGSKVFPDDPLCQTYKIDVGDTFDRIARRNKVPYQFLCKLNPSADPHRLLEGQKIKLVKGPIHLKVIKHDLMMYVFIQDTIFAKYEVCLGKNGKTPEGKWIAEDRIRRPVYVDPDTGETFSSNDPKNPTGGFWVRLLGVEGGAVGKTGFGIHGTTEPETIGKFMSKGCIRLRNAEMAQVFDMLTPGVTEVYTLP